jgi:hypothetical protein
MEEIKKQVRRVVMPSAKLMEFLGRRAPQEFVQAKLLELHSDVRTGQVILHIDTKTDQVMDDAGHPVPLDHELNWDEIFGIIPCAASGEMTPVENITVSGKAYNALRRRLQDFAQVVYKETCIMGTDSGNTKVAAEAREQLDNMPPDV